MRRLAFTITLGTKKPNNLDNKDAIKSRDGNRVVGTLQFCVEKLNILLKGYFLHIIQLEVNETPRRRTYTHTQIQLFNGTRNLFCFKVYYNPRPQMSR